MQTSEKIWLPSHQKTFLPLISRKDYYQKPTKSSDFFPRPVSSEQDLQFHKYKNLPLNEALWKMRVDNFETLCALMCKAKSENYILKIEDLKEVFTEADPVNKALRSIAAFEHMTRQRGLLVYGSARPMSGSEPIQRGGLETLSGFLDDLRSPKAAKARKIQEAMQNLYKRAFEIGAELGLLEGSFIVNGAGPGTMEASARGFKSTSKEGMSIGHSVIGLLFGTEMMNPYHDICVIHPDFEQRIQSMRHDAANVLALAGGTGTLHEIVDALTRMQYDRLVYPHEPESIPSQLMLDVTYEPVPNNPISRKLEEIKRNSGYNHNVFVNLYNELCQSGLASDISRYIRVVGPLDTPKQVLSLLFPQNSRIWIAS